MKEGWLRWTRLGGRPVSSSLRIVGTYRPIVGDVDGDRYDGIVWCS